MKLPLKKPLLLLSFIILSGIVAISSTISGDDSIDLFVKWEVGGMKPDKFFRVLVNKVLPETRNIE